MNCLTVKIKSKNGTEKKIIQAGSVNLYGAYFLIFFVSSGGINYIYIVADSK